MRKSLKVATEAGGVNNVESIPPESWQAIREFLRKSNAVKSSVPMNQGAPSPDLRKYQMQEMSQNNNNNDIDIISSLRQIPRLVLVLGGPLFSYLRARVS